MAKNKQKINKLDSFFIIILSFVLIGSLGGFLLLNNILAGSQDFDKSELEGIEPTVLLDKDGNVFKELSPGDGVRENVTYDELPQSVVDAFLAIEDSRFFKHNGFDLPRFMKSMYENVKAGGITQGGSTLTMQMIDVTHGTTDNEMSTLDNIFAKIQEIFLAMDAESQISKKEIMMNYLNYINFGGPARGIQKGAQYYFGKDVSELNLSESAFLAGVINSPNLFNPYYNYEYAKERRNETLSLMMYHGYISESEYELASNTELAFQLGGVTNFDSAPYLSFIDYVAEEVKELTNGLNIYDGNLIVHTTMDRGAQELADSMLNGTSITYPDDALFQTGFALVNNETLGIAALGGGRGYDGNDRIARSFKQQKQTGSAIKPIMDYCLTFDYLGWATSHIIADVPMNYRGSSIPIGNANGLNQGDVTYEYAIAESLNTTAIKALEDVADTIGVQRIMDHMRALGFSRFNDMDASQFQHTMGIGGGEMTSTPLEMAGAYAMFANGGEFTKPYAITRIEFRDGSQEDIIPVHETTSVISPQAAYLMSDLLEKSVSGGHPNLQQIMRSPYKVYAKTGTSDWADDGLEYGIPIGAMKDKWLVAYTSEYTASAWAGYDVPIAGLNTYVDRTKMLVNVPGQVCRGLFDYLFTDHYPAPLEQPSGVVSIQHIKGAFDGGYYAVPEGTPDSMVASGLIKSEYATLKTLAPDEIASLNSFTAEVNKNKGKIDFEFTPYPDMEALKEFDGKYHGVEGFNDFEGLKLFDKKAVYGPIVYRIDVKINGMNMGSFDFTQETGSETFNIPNRSEVELCGSYAYKNNDISSNKVCVLLSEKDTAHIGDSQGPSRPDPEEEGPQRPSEPDDPTDEDNENIPTAPTNPNED